MRQLAAYLLIIVLLLSAGCTKQPAVTYTPEPGTSSTYTPVKPSNASPSPTTTEPAPSTTPEVEQLKVVGQIGGPTKAVAVSGKYAYVGVGIRVTILDTSNPLATDEIGATQPFGGEVRDIAVSGNFVYVAAAGAGIYIVNMTDPSQPVITGQLDTEGYSEAILVEGKYAYIADGPTGLCIADISDPAKPVVVAESYRLNYIFDVVIIGSYAYLAAAGAGLLVVDISNLKEPVEKGSYDTPGYAYGVTGSRDSLYIADGWGGVQTYDISSPDLPQNISSYITVGWAMDLSEVGNRLYVADANGGLLVFDITDRTNSFELGSYAVDGGHAAKLAVNGNVAFIADIYSGLLMVDVSIPSKPVEINRYTPMEYAYAVSVSGNYAYVTMGEDGLRVIDLSDPSMPEEVASLKLDGSCTTIAVSGTVAYVSALPADRKVSYLLYPIDISNPLHPVAAQPVPLIGKKGNQTFIGKDYLSDSDTSGICTRTVLIHSNTLYYAGEWGMMAVDISDPLSPNVIGFLQTSIMPGADNPAENIGTNIGVAVVGDIAYLAVMGGGLDIVNIKEPTSSTLLSVFQPETKLGFLEVVVSLPYVYIIDNTPTLRVIDVSDPVHIKSISSISLPANPASAGSPDAAASSIIIDGNNLFIADGVAGLLMFDITDPAKPRLADRMSLHGLSKWIDVNNGLVFVACWDGGIYIVENSSYSPESKVSSSSKRQGFPTERAFLFSSPADESQSVNTTSPVDTTSQTYGKGTTYTVSTTEYTGPGSLLESVLKANSGDIIIFDPQVFPPDNPATIYVTSLLALPRGGITIDASNAGVILDGSKAPDVSTGLCISTNNNVIKGLQILNFRGFGIFMQNGHYNIIGGDRTKGKGPLGEGNLISGNSFTEFDIQKSSHNLVVGNFIGTDITGTKKVGAPTFNFFMSFEMNSPHNRIENNIIAGGISVMDFGTSYNEFTRNHIGVDVTGTVAFEGEAALGICSPFNRIGGTKPGDRNIINGSVCLNLASDTIVQGNYIGTDITGKEAFGNNLRAVWLTGSQHNFIGGTTTSEGNILNGKGELVSIETTSNYNIIAGNNIGTDIAGKIAMGNFVGISLNNAEHNYIQGNLVSGSERAGICLAYSYAPNSGANFNLLRANIISHCDKIGIGIRGGEGNKIINNQIINNYGEDQGFNNKWDDGHTGNYWSVYNGKDSNADGIGDTPCQIFPNGVDRYPLMKPPE